MEKFVLIAILRNHKSDKAMCEMIDTFIRRNKINLIWMEHCDSSAGASKKR
jgi:hypothetical protein